MSEQNRRSEMSRKSNYPIFVRYLRQKTLAEVRNLFERQMHLYQFKNNSKWNIWIFFYVFSSWRLLSSEEWPNNILLAS